MRCSGYYGWIQTDNLCTVRVRVAGASLSRIAKQQYNSSMGNNTKPVLGFDLGGTKMLCGLVENGRTVTAHKKKKTKEVSKPEELVERMVSCVEGCLEEAGLDAKDVEALGVAAPGPINLKTGTLLNPPNLGVKEFPLAKMLSKQLGIPVVLENDVNAGLYGEFVAGSAQGYKHVVGLFPGTGLGGGMILNGELYYGVSGAAGEIGHMTVQPGGRLCGCGNRGCLEAVASRGAMAREAAVLVGAGKSPTIAREAGMDISKMKSGVFADAVEAGEEAVIELVNNAAWWLGVGMANCVNIFNPEVIVVGGGLVEKLGKSYLKVAEAAMREHAMPTLSKNVRVVAAALADDAAVIGSAVVATRTLAAKAKNGSAHAS